MIKSLGFIFIFGLILGSICKKIKIPSIVGMILTGIIIGPNVLNILDNDIIMISSDLRKIALIIILLKAGFSLNIKDLVKVGRSAVMLSFIPASFEILAFALHAPKLLNISFVDSLLLGTVIAAVSPAVVVPRMVNFIENNYATKKSIPQMILAGSSCDDIYVIVLFTSFLGMSMGNTFSYSSLLNIPISIVLGIIFGVSLAYALNLFFEFMYKKGSYIKNSIKIVIILGISFLISYIEDALKNYLQISSLIAIMSMACTMKINGEVKVIRRLSEKLSKVWIPAELLLFVLVGAAVDVRYATNIGFSAIIMLIISQVYRGAGVYLSLFGTKLSYREKLFCIFSYIPKATVQAAIGAVPISYGISSGNVILSVAVLAILITAPIGAALIDNTYKILLNKD